jgi:hypothetical protein
METTNYENRKFMIFSTTELDQIDFNQVHETSANTIRKSIDNTKTFVKWDEEIPQCVSNLTTKEGPYTYEEMLEILATEAWTGSDLLSMS